MSARYAAGDAVRVRTAYPAGHCRPPCYCPGETGGGAVQQPPEYVRSPVARPVIAFIAGATAPPGRRMGHAGAIIVGAAGTAQAKKDALAAAGATIVDSPAEIGAVTQGVLTDRGLS